MYDVLGVSGKEGVAPSEDDTEMPGSPSDRLLMWSAGSGAPHVETEFTASRTHVLVSNAKPTKAGWKSSSSNATNPGTMLESPSTILQPSPTYVGRDSEAVAGDEIVESEYYHVKTGQRHKPNRDTRDCIHKNISSPATSSLLGFEWSAIDEGHRDGTTAIPERTRAMEMRARTALIISVEPFPGAIHPRHTAESNLPSRRIGRSRLAHKAGGEQAGRNSRHRHSYIETVPTNSETSDAETLIFSGGPLGHDGGGAASQKKSSSIHEVERESSGAIKRWHETSFSPHNNSTVKQFMVNNQRPQTHNATQDYLLRHDQDKVPGILENEGTLTTSENLEEDIEDEPECYRVVRNGHRNHRIVRLHKNVPQWKCLASLQDMTYRGGKYKVGDIVYILLQDYAKDSCAKICDIRDLGDGRKVISALWHFTIKDARSCGCKTLKRWPKGKTHMLTNMLQILMWDTINGMADSEVLDRLESGKILDVCSKTCTIVESNAKIVDWISDLLPWRLD